MKPPFSSLIASWQSFWFRPDAPLALDISRIVFYFAFLHRYLATDYVFFSRLGQHFWHPASFYQIIAAHGPPAVAWVFWLQILWKISLACSMAGLFTRPSTMVSCVLGLYLMAIPANFGLANHSHASSALGIGLVVMALSRCGRTLSLDQWIFKSPTPAASSEFRWPVQLMRTVVSVAFFGAGYNKLHRCGVAWITSDTLQIYLVQADTYLGLKLAEFPMACHFLAAGTIVVEFFHPLALFSRRLLYFFVPAGLFMLLGFKLFLGISFLPLILLHVFWMPWGEIFEYKAGKGASFAPVLLGIVLPVVCVVLAASDMIRKLQPGAGGL